MTLTSHPLVLCLDSLLTSPDQRSLPFILYPFLHREVANSVPPRLKRQSWSDRSPREPASGDQAPVSSIESSKQPGATSHCCQSRHAVIFYDWPTSISCLTTTDQLPRVSGFAIPNQNTGMSRGAVKIYTNSASVKVGCAIVVFFTGTLPRKTHLFDYKSLQRFRGLLSMHKTFAKVTVLIGQVVAHPQLNTPITGRVQ